MTAKTPVNVDGILPKHVTAAVLERPAQYNRTVPATVTKPVMDIVRAPARHLPKRHTQPGQTLMRRSLVKPSPSLKRTTKVLAANPKQAATTIANVKPKTSAAVVDVKKEKHASRISQSAKIQRFNNQAVSGSPRHAGSIMKNESVYTKTSFAEALAARPAPDLFERALASAKSHEQSTPAHVRKSLKRGSKSKRFTNIAAGSLAVLLIAGFVGYQNLPAMKVRYASQQAGFQAQLPEYRPSGFSIGKLSYQTGLVSVNFTSNSDSRAFAITQQPSAWDSQTLRENYVIGKDTAYRTAMAAGQTVYVYGKNNATWVSGGIWYQLQTEGSLTERQLTQIASSM